MEHVELSKLAGYDIEYILPEASKYLPDPGTVDPECQYVLASRDIAFHQSIHHLRGDANQYIESDPRSYSLWVLYRNILRHG